MQEVRFPFSCNIIYLLFFEGSHSGLLLLLFCFCQILQVLLGWLRHVFQCKTSYLKPKTDLVNNGLPLREK